eukprot:CAMPEP_0172713380 /NCGR_PEP_ID=MMETSP1074-20121228/62305_1 /TAXON_ID=2916 /ORGANISM="Ceratium fusus, Strain PA161109" /LENGTH=60 /DNA_ID=CAMNT_0013537467 /DNA_START=10 /DNA_END=188 /DNA_ORIENTATION=-
MVSLATDSKSKVFSIAAKGGFTNSTTSATSAGAMFLAGASLAMLRTTCHTTSSKQALVEP